MLGKLALLIGITLLITMPLAGSAEQTTIVLADHQRCENDTDCIRLVLKRSCDCGVPVNIKYMDSYLNAKQERCKDYSGPMCKLACPERIACVQKKCVVIGPSPKSD